MNLRKLLPLLLGGVLALGLSGAAAAKDKIKIGWTAWSDAEAVTRLAADILESRLDQPVELVLLDIGIQYQGLANGDIDAMLPVPLYWRRQLANLSTLDLPTDRPRPVAPSARSRPSRPSIRPWGRIRISRRWP